MDFKRVKWLGESDDDDVAMMMKGLRIWIFV